MYDDCDTASVRVRDTCVLCSHRLDLHPNRHIPNHYLSGVNRHDGTPAQAGDSVHTKCWKKPSKIAVFKPLGDPVQAPSALKKRKIEHTQPVQESKRSSGANKRFKGLYRTFVGDSLLLASA
jgi:hypothetical protein